MKNIAIFGGTFNPIHNGHINIINKVNEKIAFDKIIIMPAKIPPHKNPTILANEWDRYQMCKLAFEGNEKAEVSDYEISNSGKSFTVFTLRHFKELYPNAKFYLILGSDMLLSFHTWYLYEEILELATLIVFSRNNSDSKSIEQYAEKLNKNSQNCIVIPIVPYDISSTEIREAILKRQDYTCYLPEKVVEYIRSKNLYL